MVRPALRRPRSHPTDQDLATMDRKLFLAIMKVHSISVDCEAVATVLTTEGDPCTKIAVMRRIQRIKEMLKDGPKNGYAANMLPADDVYIANFFLTIVLMRRMLPLMARLRRSAVRPLLRTALRARRRRLRRRSNGSQVTRKNRCSLEGRRKEGDAGRD